MVVGIESVTLHSKSAKALADFYRDKVGLKLTIEAEMGEGMDVFGFGMDGADLYIISNPKVVGKNTNPDEVIFSLEVDDIEKESDRLGLAGAKKLGDFYHLEGYGYICDFEDPDGNHFRLVQVKE